MIAFSELSLQEKGNWEDVLAIENSDYLYNIVDLTKKMHRTDFIMSESIL